MTSKIKNISKQISNRQFLLQRAVSNPQFKPTYKEIKEAYGYLDYCYNCGEYIKLFEPYEHQLLGNYHKYGCSVKTRKIVRFYKIVSLPLLILLFPVKVIYYVVRNGIKYLWLNHIEKYFKP